MPSSSATAATERDPLPLASALIDQGKFGEARALLQSADEPAELVRLLDLKLQVAERKLEPALALRHAVALLRSSPGDPLVLGIYKQLSMAEHRAGRSCMSHSHPPPSRSS